MTTDAALPVPLRLQLPGPEWRAVDPAAWGVSNAALLAVRGGLDGDYVPTIAVSGDWRNDGTPIEAIADESLAKLRAEGATDVELIKRRVTGGEHTPSVAQSIGATVVVDGRRFDVRQAQVVAGLIDVDDPTKRVVVIYTLSCTYQQLPAMGPEFQRFVASIRVVPDDDVTWDDAGSGDQR
ncbi:hypothetical protein [Nocardioides ferulae]|uniref:hypothetical protein n=1 Tax=Nocardioides ferulae TaxID=2340821 RepID=UPI000EB19872|nr:hypothetical protein [Nocardioides ferulae]